MANIPRLSDLAGLKEIPKGAVDVLTGDGIFSVVDAGDDVIYTAVTTEEQKPISIHKVTAVILGEGWVYDPVAQTFTLPIKVRKEQIRATIAGYNSKIAALEKEMAHLTSIEKPYVCCAVGVFGQITSHWKTQEQAEKKLREYHFKKYIRNKRLDGVYVYHIEPDGRKKVVKSLALNSFYTLKIDKEDYLM